jgi:asparagine synthetase B (glutamine-hydrolysing)
MEALLIKTIRRYCRSRRTAILFTGGLDSTILALLFRSKKPILVFGAVDAPECQNYNRTSINLCTKISALLELRFQTITITRQDYLGQMVTCLKSSDQPPFDTDLPAACFIFRTLHKYGMSSVISGMGSDEIFRLPKKLLQTFITRQAKTALMAHQKIAAKWKIKFNCPYLSREIIQYSYRTPLHNRKNKQALRLILKAHPAISSLLQDRTAAHSIIPESFWRPALPLIKKKYASWSENASKVLFPPCSNIPCLPVH